MPRQSCRNQPTSITASEGASDSEDAHEQESCRESSEGTRRNSKTDDRTRRRVDHRLAYVGRG
jgi:hypothetical protein